MQRMCRVQTCWITQLVQVNGLVTYQLGILKKICKKNSTVEKMVEYQDTLSKLKNNKSKPIKNFCEKAGSIEISVLSSKNCLSKNCIQIVETVFVNSKSTDQFGRNNSPNSKNCIRIVKTIFVNAKSIVTI